MTDLRAVRPVVFLDVDGVLNHVGCNWETNAVHSIDPACVQQLRRILDNTGAHIVLSSVWRLSRSSLDALAVAGVPVWDLTPVLDDGLERRAGEIRAWLDAHPGITQWAVLDDEIDADLRDGSFFRTDFMDGGLTEQIATEVLAHLRRALAASPRAEPHERTE